MKGLPLFVKPGRRFRSFSRCTKSFGDSFTGDGDRRASARRAMPGGFVPIHRCMVRTEESCR
jgi:hypothetical protein